MTDFLVPLGLVLVFFGVAIPEPLVSLIGAALLLVYILRHSS